MVIEEGGWHASYVEVLAITNEGLFAVALVDGNGDRSDIEAEHWLFEDGEWGEISSSGAFGPDYEDPDNLWQACGGFGGDEVGACRFDWGFGRGFRTVELEFEDASYQVPVLGNGWWVFLTAAHDFDETPKVTLTP
jgi:hypothetical protein